MDIFYSAALINFELLPALKLTEAQRKQAFYELVVYQDSISINDLQRNEKMKEAYLIIAKKYDITEDEMKQIGVEGIEKN